MNVEILKQAAAKLPDVTKSSHEKLQKPANEKVHTSS